jgi:DNA processing protein
LVVESDVKGGSMLTADLASSYHRDVMAVPGSVFSEKSKGPHALVLALKGSLVTSGNDIAKLMSWQKVKSVEQVSLFPDLSKDDLEVLSMLQSNPMHIDQLSMEYDHGRGKLMQVLLSMEMRGLVKTMPGSRYAVSGALEGIH